ncbi:NAD(P)/FAD-dependent oxidoreductase [Egicoccus halophilus]|uniref:FAD-dependent oxidoreductase n=1 Tax=Egicoccus halophilus TaxID=1670830 RepID=A0A8J3ACK4_9ACTN|nr:FAD-dependent oxidoreductase [Egicoccus halophilus]GGI08554.1 FAD-dependent oxidoreductase [Egicoccus halophilus]
MADDPYRAPGPAPAWGRVGIAARPLPPLEPLTTSTRADVCVVGLGASGLTAALHLAERGAEVVAIDAYGIAAGAAGRNGGFLLAGLARFHHDAVAAYGRARAVGLYRWTLDELDRTLADLPDDVARRVGSLRIAADDAEFADVDRMLAQLQADGLPAEPYVGPEGTGALVPSDAVMDPHARCAVLAERALAAGARLHAPTRVTDVATDGVRVTANGVRDDADVGRGDTDGRGDARRLRIAADRVVVAVDGGLEVLLPELAGRVETVRLQMLATAPEQGVTLPRPVYRRWGSDYVQQLSSGEVLLGGFRDRGRAEQGAPPVPSDDVQACLDAELRRLGVRAPVTHRWAARAAFTTDRLPVCDEVRPGVFAVGGYSGHGNLIGTACARLAADAALDGGRPELPV